MTTAEREQQRTDALVRANEVRIANAALRRELSGMSHEQGCRRVAELLEDPTGPVLTFPVGRLLTSITRVGEDGMVRYLRTAEIFSTTKRVGALTVRQRTRLAVLLENRRLLFPYSS